jgi:succinate dehydrogenase/fumarate reductase flavoprotein subunit
VSDKTITTDILVIGGGLAGCFSAIRAREMGADVVLADKNYVGKTGSSHFAQDFMVFNEAWGDNLKDWTDQFSRIGEYVSDRSWDEILLKESHLRYLDLMSWGESFYKKDNTPGFPKPSEEPWRSVIRKTEYRYTRARPMHLSLIAWWVSSCISARSACVVSLI